MHRRREAQSEGEAVPETEPQRYKVRHPCISTDVHKHTRSSSSSSFSHFYVGSMCDDIRLDVARLYTSSTDTPFSLTSSIALSNHFLLGLPLFLLPCTFISIALLPTQCSCLLITCPYHFNLLSWTSFVISPTFVVPLILSFLILFQLRNSAHPSYHCISATSNFFSCAKPTIAFTPGIPTCCKFCRHDFQYQQERLLCDPTSQNESLL